MKKLKSIETFLALVFMLFSILLVVFSLKSNPFSQYLHGHDSSMFLYFGKGMSRGLIPYTDMFDHKGPVLFFIQYLATFLGDNLNLGIWIIEVIWFSITCIVVFKTCTLFIKDQLLSSVAIMLNVGLIIRCFEGGNLSEQYALLFIAIAFYLFNKLIQQSTLSNFEYIVIGISGALVFFIRANMVALWLVYCLYLLITGLLNKEKKELLRQVIFIFIGGISVVILIILYGLVTNSLSDMIQQAFLMNIKYASVSITEKIGAGTKFFEFLNLAGIFFFIVVYLIYFLGLERKTIVFKQNTLLILYFVVNFYTVFVSGRFYLHYLTTQLVVVIILTAQVLKYLSERNSNVKIRIPIALLMLSLTMFFNLETFSKYTKVINTRVSVEKKYVQEVSNFIVENTESEDSIYVHNINANLYLLSGRFANSRYFVLPSLNYQKFPELSKEFSEELINNPPKIVIVKQSFKDSSDNKTNLNYQLAQVINKSYEEVQATNDPGAYIVYKYIGNK